MQHARIDPMQLFMIACRRKDCTSCASIPAQRLELADYYHKNWNSNPAPLVQVNLPKGGHRFMGLMELEQLPAESRNLYQMTLPQAFDKGFQRCKFCYFFADKFNLLTRHLNGAHPEKILTDCFPRPFTCLHQAPRPTNSQGIPIGPPTPRCLETFPTRAKLESHKSGHTDGKKKVTKKKAAPKAVQQQRVGEIPNPASAPQATTP